MSEEQPAPTWQVEQARLTVFPRTPVTIEGLTWWKDLFGEEPEQSSRRPRDGILDETGDFPSGQIESAKLALHVEPLRVDWRLNPPEVVSPPVARPLIGDLGPTAAEFVECMERWLPSAPPTNRLALGLILLSEVSGLEAGYLQLGQYLRIEPDFKGASNFLYQVNRRRPAKSLPGAEVNRLSKWSVASIRGAIIATSGSLMATTMEPTYSTRVEIDVNTAPEWQGQIPPEALPELLHEFHDLALEIAAEGDVA